MHTFAAAIAGKKEWRSYKCKPPIHSRADLQSSTKEPYSFFHSTPGPKNILLLLFFIYPRPKEFITAPLAQPLRDMADQTQMFITDNQDTIARSVNQQKHTTLPTKWRKSVLETDSQVKLDQGYCAWLKWVVKRVIIQLAQLCLTRW